MTEYNLILGQCIFYVGKRKCYLWLYEKSMISYCLYIPGVGNQRQTGDPIGVGSNDESKHEQPERSV